jgi:hypothetical protein
VTSADVRLESREQEHLEFQSRSMLHLHPSSRS